MKIVAVIPARGGSRRIPRKNVLPLAGKPLIVHSIEHAKRSRFVDRVCVSTDDEEITRISSAAGAEVIQRPAEISGDKAGSESALVHVLAELKSQGYVPDLVVFLQCTSPVRHPCDIDQAIEQLLNSGADSLLSGCRNDKFIWRNENGRLRALNYDPENRPREQDCPEEYRENGSIYIFRREVLEKHGNRIGGKVIMYEMDFWSSFQVDSMEDVELMRFIMEQKK